MDQVLFQRQADVQISAGSACTAGTAPYLSSSGALLSLAAAVLLCWPMLLTSAPLVYFDTLSYFSNGEQIWGRLLVITGIVSPHDALEAMRGAGAGGGTGLTAGGKASAAAITFRSLPYAAFFYPASLTPLGMVLACIGQTAMVLWVFLGLVPPLAREQRYAAIAGSVAVGLLSTLPWFASYAMPDILGASLLIYFALALGRMDTLDPIQKTALVAIATFATLSHYGHLPLALVLGVAAAVWRWVRGRANRTALSVCLLPIILALGVNLAASIIAGVVYARPVDAPVSSSSTIARSVSAVHVDAPATKPDKVQPSLAPNRVPVLLARSIEDGPGQRYLQQECRAQARYALCELFGTDIPGNVWKILWAPDGIRRATPEQMARIRAEETEIVFAAARRYPVDQAIAFSKNTLRQMVLVGTGELVPLPANTSLTDHTTIAPDESDNTRDPVLHAFDWITPIFTAVGFLVLAWRMVTGRTQAWLTEVALMVMFGLIINAAIYGGLSAPVDRYQSRLAWLIPALLALDLAAWAAPAWSSGGRLKNLEPKGENSAAPADVFIVR